MHGRKGQSTLEYALIIGVIIAALLLLNAYMRRGVSGRLKESTDQIGQQFDPTNGYRVGYQTSSAGQTVSTETANTATGAVTTNIVQSETVTSNERSSWGTEPQSLW